MGGGLGAETLAWTWSKTNSTHYELCPCQHNITCPESQTCLDLVFTNNPSIIKMSPLQLAWELILLCYMILLVRSPVTPPKVEIIQI